MYGYENLCLPSCRGQRYWITLGLPYELAWNFSGPLQKQHTPLTVELSLLPPIKSGLNVCLLSLKCKIHVSRHLYLFVLLVCSRCLVVWHTQGASRTFVEWCWGRNRPVDLVANVYCFCSLYLLPVPINSLYFVKDLRWLQLSGLRTGL